MSKTLLDYFPYKVSGLQAMSIETLRKLVISLQERNNPLEKNVLDYYKSWLTYYESNEGEINT